MAQKINIKQVERLVIAGLVLFFLFWMLRQCTKNSDKEELMQPIKTETPATTPTATPPTSTTAPVTQPTVTTTIPVRVDTVVRTEYRPAPLFVWTSGLKLRIEPTLNSPIVAELPINSQVTYLDQSTNFKQKVTLDGVEYNEPWIKVRSTDGKEGWVYGGGVRFYRK
jgi:hypothetical protein